MKFHFNTAEVYIPDSEPVEQALARTTHLCLAAHQDDIEIMAAQPIIECFQQQDKWFTGVVVTDGRGSPRDSLYQNYTDDEMRLVRFKEQRKAAIVGEFAAQIMLDIPSKVIKDATRNEPADDILAILRATKPKVVYTHNLADKHDTHVGVALRVIQALRKLDLAERPERDEVIVSGGGAHNRILMAMLIGCLAPARVTTSEEYGLGIEAKEAVAFAVLAYETWHKRPGNFPTVTGASRAVVLGNITY